MGTGLTAKPEGGGEGNWIPFRFVRRATRLVGYRASPTTTTGGVYVGQGIPLQWTVSFIAEGEEEGKGVS